MNIIIKDLTSGAGLSKFEKLIKILRGGVLFDESYRFDSIENKCYFEIQRYYLEKPIKETKLLFLFPAYECCAIKSAIEVTFVTKIEESKDGYEDLEIDLSKDEKKIEIGTYKHTFLLTISKNTVLKIYDISTEVKNPRYGCFPKGIYSELRDIIKQLSS